MTVSKNIALDPYISVDRKGQTSFGGSQTWFPKDEKGHLRTLHEGGCGLIAAADFLLYYGRKEKTFVKAMPKAFIAAPDKPLSEEDYLALVNSLSKFSFPVIPKLGAFSFEICLFMNRFFKKTGRDERLTYLIFNTKKRRTELIRKQLEAGYPVPLCLGQHLFRPTSHQGVNFYVFKEGKPVIAVPGIYRHFVTITGIYLPDDASLPLYYEISSWGQKYWIEAEELSRYMSRESAPWLSSVFILKSVKKG